MVWEKTEELRVYSEGREKRGNQSLSKRGIKSAGHKKKWHTSGYDTLSHKLADKTFSSELFSPTVTDAASSEEQELKTGVLSFTGSEGWT